MSVWNAKRQFCRAQRAIANYYEAFGEVMETKPQTGRAAIPLERPIQWSEHNGARA
jgi:hypothetical protein